MACKAGIGTIIPAKRYIIPEKAPRHPGLRPDDVYGRDGGIFFNEKQDPCESRGPVFWLDQQNLSVHSATDQVFHNFRLSKS